MFLDGALQSLRPGIISSFYPSETMFQDFDSASSYIASFQIVLASDASKSYVLGKYSSCLTSISSLNSIPGAYYLLSNGQQMSIQIPGNPCTNSNVNLAGTWVTDVTSINGKNQAFLKLFCCKLPKVKFKQTF